MPSRRSATRRLYPISPQGGDSAYGSNDDSNDDSFSFTRSDKGIGSDCVNANGHQVYDEPLTHRSSPEVYTFDDDTITRTVELFDEDRDSDNDYCSKDSNDDFLSIDSTMHLSKTPYNFSSDVWKFDGLSSFPFFTLPSAHSENHKVSSSFPFLSKKSSESNSQCSESSQSLSPNLSHSNHSFELMNGLEENSVDRSRCKDRTLDGTLSCSSFTALDNSVTWNQPSTEFSGKGVLKTEISRQRSTSITHDLTAINSTSSSSYHTRTSSSEIGPNAINFANASLERSHERKLSSDFYTLSPCNPSHATTEESMPASPLVSQKSSSVSPSITSHTFKTPYRIEYYKPTKAVELVEMLLDDMSCTSHSYRLQMIKRKLRSMEIKYYRRKCVWSLRKSMAHYVNIDAVNESSFDCDDVSICSELSVPHYSYRDKFISLAQGLEIVWEIMCYNLVIAIVYVFYISIYKDSGYTASEVVKIKRSILGP